jgi:hypothetical protein
MSAAEIEWACTPEEVAALLRARTKDAQMTETGMWSAETRPTLDSGATRSSRWPSTR